MVNTIIYLFMKFLLCCKKQYTGQPQMYSNLVYQNLKTLTFFFTYNRKCFALSTLLNTFVPGFILNVAKLDIYRIVSNLYLYKIKTTENLTIQQLFWCLLTKLYGYSWPSDIRQPTRISGVWLIWGETSLTTINHLRTKEFFILENKVSIV